MSESMPPLSDTDAIRADIYHLLASLLRQAPDAELLSFLASLESDDDGSQLAACWAELVGAARASRVDELARAHFDHLVGVIQGDVVPYASWYLQGELMDSALVALRRDLRHLGFERRSAVHEPEDHLAAECEVMAMLVEAGGEAQWVFLKQHLTPWAGRCFSDMAALASPFYAATGRLGCAFIESERALADARTGDQPVRIMAP